jgi:hypothetical protein
MVEVIEAFSGFFALERRAQNDGKKQVRKQKKEQKQKQEQEQEQKQIPPLRCGMTTKKQ